MKKRTKVKILFFLSASAVFGLLFAMMIQRQWFQTWHLKFANFLYHQSSSEASEDIVLVAIDDKSFERKNASELKTLQFTKSDYAKVIENLEKAGASAIGVDVIFSENSDAKDKAVLVEVLEKFDNIILAAEPKTKKVAGLKPLLEFMQIHPENMGSILFETDPDNLIRRQGIVFDDPGAPVAFATQLARVKLNLLPTDSKIVPQGYELMPFAVRVGSEKIPPIRIPLDSSGKMMINFFGPPNSFRSISFVDALEDRLADRRTNTLLDLKGKIVLIGEMGTGLHDEQYVPTSMSRPMPGVEIHANALQTILSRHFLVEQSSWGIWLVTLVAILVGLVLFLNLGILFSVIYLALAWAFYTVVIWGAFEYGLILNTVFPYLALLTTFVVAYLFRYFTEVRHSRHTEKAFSKYVSHHVVKKILEHPEHLKLGGEKKEMTVLFSDIAGFTTISEKSKPEQLVEQLNEYLDTMTGIILDSDGTLDKYIGDAIMAFWGAPLPQSNHATRACLASLDYQAKLAELRYKWVASGRLPFSARIGLNTGPMVVGNMGSHRHFNYTVIGDAVNLASRLESVNKVFGTDILISESTYHEAKDHVEAREIDLIVVKGKTKPIRIYELVAKKGKLTETQKRRNHQFHEGLLEYRKQEWDKAIYAFKKTLEIVPDDGPSKAYIERCEHLRHEKLSHDWDGSYTMKTK